MTVTERLTLLTSRLESVRQRIAKACDRVNRDPAGVTLVAVTKTVDVDAVRMLIDLGVRDFGENRPQELWRKAAAIPDARWHFIGHLQRNKLDRTIPLVWLMHSVDSERLLAALGEFGVKRGSPVPVLLEVNCSREEAKGGFAPEALAGIVSRFPSLSGVSMTGLMTMAAYHDDPEACRPTFHELRELRNQYGPAWPHLSMGMSNDFEVAIEEGATLVRVGTTLFEGLN
jgi:hypothetical protein